MTRGRAPRRSTSRRSNPGVTRPNPPVVHWDRRGEGPPGERSPHLKVTKANAYDVYVEACEAAKAAALACVPEPMLVGTAKSIISDEIDFTKPTYVVAGGVCGRASVWIRPARGALVTFLKGRGIGYKRYYGGYSVGSYSFYRPEGPLVQSMEVAIASARAAAAVFAKYGVECGVDSSLD